MATAPSTKTAEEIRLQIAALEADLRAVEQAEAKATQAGDAKRAIALLAAMKVAFKEIEALYPGTFHPEKWMVAFGSTSWPRFDKLRRHADLSETEAANARQAGEAAVSALK